MAEDLSERTEAPTVRRRREARRQGHVAHSSELSTAIHLMTVVACFYFAGVRFFVGSAQFLRQSLLRAGENDADQLIAASVSSSQAWLSQEILPGMLFLAFGIVLAHLTQVGVLLTPSKLLPDAKRLSALSGVRRIFSAETATRLLSSFGKVVVLASVAVVFVSSRLNEIIRLAQNGPNIGIRYLGQSALELSFWMAGSLLLLGLLDYLVERWRFEQSLKMTRRELLDELKNMEGDPQIHRRRRETHRKLASG
ncbi:MAG: hypothetical protein CMJ78_04065 [Planctomycetaceae bacterium]|nr:hypothetical protein [Planctomycetaceae bacterium]